MSQIKETASLPVGKGTVLRIFVDYSKPEDSLDRQWTETTYDGSETIFEIPAHWHKYHDELMTLLEGKVEVVIEGKKQIIEASDEVLRIPRWKVHSMKTFVGVPMKLKERTDPTGTFKGDFFRDLLSPPTYPGPFLHVMRAFYDGDTYPALPGNIKLLDQAFINVVGFIATMVLPKRKTGTQ